MSFPRYPAYRDSGVPWLGPVPEHWGVQRLKTLFNLMKRPPMEDDGIVTAFRDGEVTLRSNRRVDGFTNALQEVGYQGIRRGDLVIHAMDAFAGAIGVSDSDGKSTPVYSVCTPVCPTVDSQYYGLTLRHMALSGFVNSLAKGIRERSTEFRWADASVVDLPVPTIEEQQAIKRFLHRETAKIDALVAEQERLITLLKEKRQAVISHAVTKGLDPSVPMKDSGVEWLGEVPAHWTLSTLARISSEKCDGPFGSGLKSDHYTESGALVVRLQNIRSAGFFDGEPAYLDIEYFLRELQRHNVVGDDVLIAGLGDDNNLVGRACVAPKGIEPALVKADCFRFRLHKDLALPSFIAHQLSASALCDSGRLATGSTRSRIPLGVMGSRVVALPPITEQRRVVQFLDAELQRLDELFTEATRAVHFLQERRSALISAAVTGQIDVRGLAPAPEPAA